MRWPNASPMRSTISPSELRPDVWSQPRPYGRVHRAGRDANAEAVRKGAQGALYQASSSEQFGKVVETPQREPRRSTRGVPTVSRRSTVHWITVNYRESLGLFAVSGILSTTRARAAASSSLRAGHRWRGAHQAWEGEGAQARHPRRAARLGLRRRLRRCDVADASAGTPDDYVIGTGRVERSPAGEAAFEAAGLDYRDHVVLDQRFLRPAEVELLVADPSRARNELGWNPTVNFQQLVTMMVDARHRTTPRRAADDARPSSPGLPGSSDSGSVRRSSTWGHRDGTAVGCGARMVCRRFARR